MAAEKTIKVLDARSDPRRTRFLSAAATQDATVTPLEAAIATGLPCFPCQWRNKVPLILGPGGHKYATADQDALRQLWRRYSGRLVGVATGKVSGPDVLDIEGVKHPRPATRLSNNRSRLPVTREHRAQSRSFHLVLQHALRMRNSTVVNFASMRIERAFFGAALRAVQKLANRSLPV